MVLLATPPGGDGAACRHEAVGQGVGGVVEGGLVGWEGLGG